MSDAKRSWGAIPGRESSVMRRRTGDTMAYERIWEFYTTKNEYTSINVYGKDPFLQSANQQKVKSDKGSLTVEPNAS